AAHIRHKREIVDLPMDMHHTYAPGSVTVKRSTVLTAPVLMLLLPMSTSAPAVPMVPSSRAAVLEGEAGLSPASAKRNQPACPSTSPMNCHSSSAVFDSTPSTAGT